MRPTGSLCAFALGTLGAFGAACSSNVNVDISGLAPLAAVGPQSLSPQARSVVKATGGSPPYRFAFVANPPATGADATIDASSGEFRLGSVGRTTEVLQVTDQRQETRMVSIQVGEALAIDPTRAVVDPVGLADFDAVGGQPPYTFRIEGVAADRIDGQTGIFVAGSEGGRTVTVIVEDGNGAQAFAQVQISLNFVAGSAPVDVAVLDADRDGIPDLAVAPSSGGSLVLLRGDGRGNFGPLAELPLGAFPRAVRAFDLNGDGLKDLLVAASSPDQIIVLVQDVGAVGGFREALRRPIAALPTDLDVLGIDSNTFAVVTTSDAGQAADVTRIRASGGLVTFIGGARIALPGRGTRLALGDFLGDAQIDLAVGVGRPQPAKSSVLYFVGNGMGVFGPTPALEIELGEGTVALGAGSLGGGRKRDLAASSSLTNELGLILDDPVTGRPTLQRFPIPPGDGAQCAPCGRPTDAACTPGAQCIQLRASQETQVCALACQSSADCPNDTDCQPIAALGRFCAPQLNTCPVTSMLPTGVNPRAVRVVDLDLDGVPEILVTNVANLEIFRAGGERLYAHGSTVATGANPWEMDVADLTGDLFPAVVTANRFTQNVSVLPGLGRLFTPLGELVVGSAPGLLAAADLDHDPQGRLDLVLQTGDAMLTLLGDGQGGFFPFRRLPFFSPGRPYLLDANGDGFLDLFSFHDLARTLEMLPWQPGIGFAGGPTTSTGIQPLGLALADLDGDGKLDAVVANNLDRNYGILWGLGGGAFMPYSTDQVLYAYADPAVQSFDVVAFAGPQGALDHLVTLGRGGGNTYFDAFRMGSGGPLQVWSQSVPTATGIGLGQLDCDGDGIGDLAVHYVGVPGNAFDVQIWRGAADGTYALATVLHTGEEVPGMTGVYTATGPDSLVAADFDGDQRTDVVVSTRLTRQLVVFQGNGDCTFTLAGRVHTSAELGGGMTAGDFDGDGRADLAASAQPDRLAIFKNLGGRTGELRDFPASGRLCDPCASDDDCGTAADLCADHVGQRRLCARDCSAGRACPAGFVCTPVGSAQQCLHAGAECVY